MLSPPFAVIPIVLQEQKPAFESTAVEEVEEAVAEEAVA